MRLSLLTALIILQCSIAAQAADEPPLQPTPASGGAATTERSNIAAFSTPVPGLAAQQRRIFAVGDHLFNTSWTIAPGSVTTKDGLGPLFNRVSCSSCHMRDGRGRPPLPGENTMLSMLVRLSVPGKDAHGGSRPHPVYGGQLNEAGIPGVPAEGKTRITWHEEPGTYADGTPYSLRRPVIRITSPGYGVLGKRTMLSARVAPAVFGSGLLEAIPARHILATADPDDKNNDGISGRPNEGWNIRTGKKELGRFGWKASQPTLEQQSAAAFVGDIGITSPLFPESSCTPAQKACLKKTQHGDQPEVDGESLTKLTQYLQMLAVPARRNHTNKQVQEGERLFYQIGCASCHTPVHNTGRHDIAQLSEQTIHPYTDLLLHDMGKSLADNRPDGKATGQEWRTPPLWGIGLQQRVNQHTFFLHDGRARNLAEAVLWHGGEGEKAREAFRALNATERNRVLAFLESL